MRSPLQVTIMATLVDTIGRAPQDKWRLFNEYFGAIYRREMERDTHRTLLSKYRSDIETIHYRVGLELQTASEKAGGTDARLTRDQFEDIVRQRLVSRKHQGEELQSLTRDIVDAATSRLVFLVEPVDGAFGFEIRSLQEFMAAEALMSGDTADVRNRLRRIAPVASWRNVFVFAAGRCFAKDEVLIDTITSICNDLNVTLGGERAKAIKAGSLLALDLLEDGSAAAIPNVSELLANSACDLLALPESDAHRRLADVYEPRFDTMYRDAINDALSRPSGARHGMWELLLRMNQNSVEWVAEVIDRIMPRDPSEQFELLLKHTREPWVGHRLAELVHLVSPSLGYRIAYSSQMPQFAQLLASPINRAVSPKPQIVGIGIDVISLSEEQRGTYKAFATIPSPHHPGWGLFKLLGEATHLSSETLSSMLIDTVGHIDVWLAGQVAPWPVVACAVRAASSKEVLGGLARRIRDGELGEYEDWMAAEARWKREGVTIEEIENEPPWNQSIRTTGFPTAALRYLRLTSGDACALYKKLGPRGREAMALAVVRCEVSDQVSEHFEPETVASVLDVVLGTVWNFDTMFLVDFESEDPRWVDVADRIGSAVVYCFPRNPVLFRTCLKWLVQNAQEHPERIGLFRAILIASRHESSVIDAIPLVEPSQIEPEQRWVALNLLAVRGMMNGTNAKRYAALAMETGIEARVFSLRQVSTAVVRAERFDDGNDLFFLHLERSLPREEFESCQAVLDYLIESFRRQRSGLGDSETWRELKLPEMPGH